LARTGLGRAGGRAPNPGDTICSKFSQGESSHVRVEGTSWRVETARLFARETVVPRMTPWSVTRIPYCGILRPDHNRSRSDSAGHRSRELTVAVRAGSWAWAGPDAQSSGAIAARIENRSPTRDQATVPIKTSVTRVPLAFPGGRGALCVTHARDQCSGDGTLNGACCGVGPVRARGHRRALVPVLVDHLPPEAGLFSCVRPAIFRRARCGR
jgi:hypothetical protein